MADAWYRNQSIGTQAKGISRMANRQLVPSPSKSTPNPRARSLTKQKKDFSERFFGRLSKTVLAS
jgi:hypothetical protein